jgi:hypothetical protein
VLPASRSLSRKKISPPGRPNEVQYNHHDPQTGARDDTGRGGLIYKTSTHEPENTTGHRFFRDSLGHRSVPKEESGHCQPPRSALSHPGTRSKRCERAGETTHSICVQAGLHRIDLPARFPLSLVALIQPGNSNSNPCRDLAAADRGTLEHSSAWGELPCRPGPAGIPCERAPPTSQPNCRSTILRDPR